MKAQVIGVQRISGVSNKSGALKDYDMGKLFCLQPIESAAKTKDDGTSYKKEGYGFEVMEVDLDSDCIKQFSAIKFPAMLDVVIEQRPMYGKLASVCIGIAKAA